jgi:hypothetical protein
MTLLRCSLMEGIWGEVGPILSFEKFFFADKKAKKHKIDEIDFVEIGGFCKN